ncbi:MAG TPA: uroporphyrinogen decarboxylase family protein [Caldilineaceae bacterium]|nr:uroporphyrinogen decarboxylase family protein [Caldilineaceae bacterium]
MAQLNKRGRVEAALRGEAVDRAPVAAWRHFIPEERRPDTLAQASLRHFHEFDWDWLKVNPRATYYAEAWGNRYDYNQYAGVYPKLIDGPLDSPAKLATIQEIDATGGVFGEQIDLVRQIKAGIGDAHFLQTVFSPLSVLAFLTARPQHHSAEEAVQAQYDGVRHYIQAAPQGVHAALHNIAVTLARYASALVESGASGLFFAIVKLARQGVLSAAEYAEFGKPYDLQVLQAVQGAPFNLLHICGPAVYFDAVADYPVDAINWAALGQQNPTVGEAVGHTRHALVGGVDERGALQKGTPEQVTQEAQAAIRATQGRHFLLAPGCGVKLGTPEANLHALRRSAELSVAA